MHLIVEVTAALAFVLSAGIFFKERYAKNPFLVGGAGLIATVSTVVLFRAGEESFFTNDFQSQIRALVGRLQEIGGAQMVDSLIWALAAAAIIAIGGYIWSQWLRRRPGLSGRWQATFTSQDGTKNAEDLEIKSWLWFVWGTSTCTWKDAAGNPKIVAYRIQGRRKERTITATYRAVDQNSLDMGVFIVRISPTGGTGNGIITSYDSPADQVEFDFQHLDACKDYHWQKVLPT